MPASACWYGTGSGCAGWLPSAWTGGGLGRAAPSRAVRGGAGAAAARPAARLPEPDREVLVLRYLEGLPTREIAAVLGVTEGAVKVRHFRALARLQAVLDENPGEGAR